MKPVRAAMACGVLWSLRPRFRGSCSSVCRGGIVASSRGARGRGECPPRRRAGKSKRGCSTCRRTAPGWPASSATSPTAKARSNRRAKSSARRSRRPPNRSCRRFRRARRSARFSSRHRARRSSIFEREVMTRASRRHARRAADSLHNGRRADGEPPGRLVGPDPGGRKRSRHACRPRRPSAPARQESRRGRVEFKVACRSDNRPSNQLRETTLTPNYLEHAEGSVFIEAGRTKVICTASIEDRVPPFLRNTGKGWVTAEYGMLPRATNTRMQREASIRKSRRPHAGDSAAHRPIAARGHQSAGPRRTHDLDRLRRHPGGRRNAHGVDHRRVRRPRAGG